MVEDTFADVMRASSESPVLEVGSGADIANYDGFVDDESTGEPAPTPTASPSEDHSTSPASNSQDPPLDPAAGPATEPTETEEEKQARIEADRLAEALRRERAERQERQDRLHGS